MKKEIILVGGGGHCISSIDTIEATGLYDIVGILDLPDKVGQKILGYSVIGTDDDIGRVIDGDRVFCITVGQVEAGETIRKKLYLKISASGVLLPAVISPYSYVSKRATVANGSIVLSGCTINADARIGENCIINSGAVIEHGVSIGNHCHISTGSVVNGDCSVGDQCFIASGVIIKNGVSIADNILVGMGSVVTKSLIDPGVYYGNPARKIK